jgi:hypothetical protein
VCSCDQVRDPEVGAGVSPSDPDQGRTESHDDMVRAVVDFVEELVDGADGRP